MKYNIVFKGEVKEGVDKDKVGQALAKSLKIPANKSDALFNGKSYTIAKGLDEEKAATFEGKFRKIGLEVYKVAIPVKDNFEAKNNTTANPSAEGRGSAATDKAVDSASLDAEHDSSVTETIHKEPAHKETADKAAPAMQSEDIGSPPFYNSVKGVDKLALLQLLFKNFFTPSTVEKGSEQHKKYKTIKAVIYTFITATFVLLAAETKLGIFTMPDYVYYPIFVIHVLSWSGVFLLRHIALQKHEGVIFSGDGNYKSKAYTLLITNSYVLLNPISGDDSERVQIHFDEISEFAQINYLKVFKNLIIHTLDGEKYSIQSNLAAKACEELAKMLPEKYNAERKASAGKQLLYAVGMVFLAVALVFFVYDYFFNDHGLGEVQNYVTDECPSRPLGMILESASTKLEWETFEADDKKRYYNAVGEVIYGEVPVNILIQYRWQKEELILAAIEANGAAMDYNFYAQIVNYGCTVN